MGQLHFDSPKELTDQLQAYADSHYMTRASVIRLAVKDYLERHKR